MNYQVDVSNNQEKLQCDLTGSFASSIERMIYITPLSTDWCVCGLNFRTDGYRQFLGKGFVPSVFHLSCLPIRDLILKIADHDESQTSIG